MRACRAPFRRCARGRGEAPQKAMFWALRDVSFEVRAGRGARRHRPQRRGQEHAAQDPLPHHRADRAAWAEITGRVGSLLEVGTGFHPELSGRENIYLNGAILGMKRAEIARKFDEIVAFAEVEQFIDTPVKHYSSGMYLRLAFAVAAHLEPEILLVDEVLAVGDAAFQKKCLGKMGTRGAAGPHGALRQPQHGRGARALDARAVPGSRAGGLHRRAERSPSGATSDSVASSEPVAGSGRHRVQRHAGERVAGGHDLARGSVRGHAAACTCAPGWPAFNLYLHVCRTARATRWPWWGSDHRQFRNADSAGMPRRDGAFSGPVAAYRRLQRVLQTDRERRGHRPSTSPTR